MENIRNIYDRIFKRIFSLSDLATVNLINGLFGTNYPPDSKVDYLRNEFVRSDLHERLSDVVLRIQDRIYHLEAQMKPDSAIVLRVFEYGYYVAMETRNGNMKLRFPNPIVIYLDQSENRPETSELCLEFEGQGEFTFTVKNFFYQEHEITELNQRKMVLLIPFRLLQIKNILNKEVNDENLEALRKLIQDDIIMSIDANRKVGNITKDDANQLFELTHKLYAHISKNYEELGGGEAMKELLPGAMELPNDKYRIRIDELEAEIKQAETKANQAETKAKRIEAEKEQAETKAKQAETEIAELRKRIIELESKE